MTRLSTATRSTMSTEENDKVIKHAGPILLAVIAFARLGGGLFLSIHGPTLLTLANNVGSTAGQVSWLFSGRSIGLLAGGVATGYMMRKTNNMIAFALASLLLALVVIATPWITDLWLLVVVVMIGGVGFGYLDAGADTPVLGEKESRPLISGYHFAISVGAFLAPLIAQPFLSMDGETSSDDVCPSSSSPDSHGNTTTLAPVVPTMTLEPVEPGHWYSNVVWAYMICGAALIVCTLMFFVLYWMNIEVSVRKLHEHEVEDRPEVNFRSVLWLMFLICVYYFCCVAGETTYNSYIYSVSICSGLGFGIHEATNINSLFWLGFGLGRLGGVLFFKFFKPHTVILVDFVGTIICMIVMVIWGETSIPVAWVITAFYSFLQGTIYPGGVSWSSQFINMSGNYIFIFSAGQALGTMTLVPTSGVIFDYEPFNVMYVVLGCTLLNAVTFVVMLFEGKRLTKKLAIGEDVPYKSFGEEKSRL